MNNLFAKAITSSIQENKDKIEKLTKQNLNLKNKNKKLKQQLEAYENMRKEAINKLKEHKWDLDYEPWSIYEIKGSILFNLVDILNKVGGSDE